ncbi:hypothetical protein BX265_8381 [Streptomyces sp. TLI_235]|nr:hypothetical protein BX265_8381 [Streptomyces sp. TLI_235]
MQAAPGALAARAGLRKLAGDREGAEELAWRPAAGHSRVPTELAQIRGRVGEGPGTLALQAADAG